MSGFWVEFWSLEAAASGFLYAFAIYGAVSWLRDCRASFRSGQQRSTPEPDQ